MNDLVMLYSGMYFQCFVGKHHVKWDFGMGMPTAGFVIRSSVISAPLHCVVQRVHDVVRVLSTLIVTLTFFFFFFKN